VRPVIGRLDSYRFTPRAERDLAELLDFVSSESGSARARALNLEIKDAARLLARMPGMGHRRDDLPPWLRVWTVHRWLILYRPEATPLEIVRIVGGWQDLTSRLGESDLV
jgi:antitoxin ParD1/3/4/toxin ParE1/3/4